VTAAPSHDIGSNWMRSYPNKRCLSLLLAFFALVSSTQLWAGQQTENQQSAQNIILHASTAPPAVLSNRGNDEKDANDEGTEFWPPIRGVRLKITDTALAIFTALLFFATLGLWLATRKLVRDASESSKTELRAYVSIADKGALFLQSELNKHTISVSVVLENAGKTPGKNFSTWFGGGFYPSESVPFPAESKRLSERVNSSIIGAGATVNIIPEPMILNDFEFQELIHGSKAIFLWGGADYTDVFGHQQSFFFRMKMTGKPINIGNGMIGWHLTPHPLGYQMS